MSDDEAVDAATAWDDALQYAYEEGYLLRHQMEALQASNPYRSQA